MNRYVRSFWMGCMSVVFFPSALLSCDICGCSSATFGMGLLPGQPQHFVGLQWTQRGYTSTHRTLFANETPIVTRELLQEVDVAGRWSISRRWQLSGKLSYRMASSEGTDQNLSTQQAGDPSLMIMRVFGDVSDTLCQRMRHVWMGGMGIEIPLVPSRLRDAKGEVMPTLLQPGSGSWDPLLRVAYIGTSDRQGWLVELQSMLSTYRKNGDRRGHQCSLSARYHRRWRLRADWAVIPHASVAADLIGREWMDQRYNNDSGGAVVYVRPGLDITYRSIAFRGYVQCPAWSRLSDGLVVPEAPLHISLIYLIQNKK